MELPHHNLFHDDDDNDDQILVVSTTQQKWEKLHGVVPNHQVLQQNWERDDTTDDDDIITVKTKPSSHISWHRRAYSVYERITHGLKPDHSILTLQNYLATIIFLFTLVLAFRFPWKRNSRNASSVVFDEVSTVSESTASSRTTKNIATTTSMKIVSVNEQSMIVTETRSATASIVASAETTISNTATLRMTTTECTSPNSNSDLDLTKQSLEHSNDHSQPPQLLKPYSSSSSAEWKLHMARELAQDIQLVESVLTEHSLDPSLAPQLAMSLQSSHHMVESQREFHYQQAILTHHQRQLDRQLSEQQHQESLRAVQYDPNWEGKLQLQRDQCWNISSGLVRLWWEGLLVQQVSRGVIPVLAQYQRGINNDKDDYRDNRMVQRVLRDMIWSVLSQVCDCHGETATIPSMDITVLTTTTSSPWTSSVATAAVLSFTSSNPLISAWLLMKGHLPQWINLEYCTCFGYCILSGSILLCATLILHYVLRVFSVPSILHHMVNLATLITFYGPHRIVLGFWKTIAIVTAISLDFEELDALSLIEFSLLLFTFVLLPLASWAHTQLLYRHIKGTVVNCNASNFGESFRNGQQRLEQWKWEQLIIRYLLLSLYSALLLRHRKDGMGSTY
jgi:hypothetical protein